MPTGSYGTLSPAAEAFLAVVEALAPEAWLAIGDLEPIDHASMRTALLIRDAALSDRSLDVDAWLVRDAVATLAWLAGQRLGRLARRDWTRLALAHQRIERAAVTQLVADALPLRDLHFLGAGMTGQLPAPAPTARRLRGWAEQAELDAG